MTTPPPDPPRRRWTDGRFDPNDPVLAEPHDPHSVLGWYAGGRGSIAAIAFGLAVIVPQGSEQGSTFSQVLYLFGVAVLGRAIRRHGSLRGWINPVYSTEMRRR